MNNVKEDIIKIINEFMDKVKRLIEDTRVYNAYKNKLKHYKRVRNRNILYKKRIAKYGK